MDSLFKENLEALQKHSDITGLYTGLSSLLEYDAWAGTPPKGRPYRDKISGFVAGEQHKHQTSGKAKALIEYFKGIDLNDDIQLAMYRELKREYELNTAVPPEKVAQLATLSSKAQLVWKEAHEKSDYGLFKPYLERIFNLSKEIADLIGLDGHPLNSLAARHEPDINVDQVAMLFQDLKVGIIKLLGKIKNSGTEIADDFLSLKFDKKTVFEFTKHVVETMGYDPMAGGYAEVLHPFSAPVGPRDARITSNYSSFKIGVFAGIHEAGHGIYMQNSHAVLADTSLWGGIPGAMHESQARFYENILGKSRAFWEYFFSEALHRFDQFTNVNLDQFYRGINRVVLSLRRATSDEVTYSLHAIIRFEIEKDILEDKIDVNELQDV
ncbi:MAG: hypothetical protein JRH15_05735, partial [Deltaproteobacteria bacterium]|nr:hypothetical protein [Deltaproteobacteria bacterium]